MHDFLDWISDDAPFWVVFPLAILFVGLGLGAITLSVFAIIKGFGWLVLGAWVFIPLYVILEAYRRSRG